MLLSEGGHDPHYNLALEEYVFSHCLFAGKAPVGLAISPGV